MNDGAEAVAQTNPLHRDSDDDLLDDGFESRYGFNPRVAGEALLDTDLDGFSNLIEARYGSSPQSGSSAPRTPGWTGHQGSAQHRGFAPIRIDISNLQRRWARRVSADGMPLHPVAVAHGRVLATADVVNAPQIVTALDAVQGTPLWRRSLGTGQYTTPPAIDQAGVLVATTTDLNPALVRMDGASGTVLFRKPMAYSHSRMPAPAVSDGDVALFEESFAAAVQTLDGESGTPRWAQPVVAFRSWTPAMDAGRVVVFTDAAPKLSRSALRIFSQTDGEEIANIRISTPGEGLATPTLGFRDDAFVVRLEDLLAFDMVSKSVRWQTSGTFRNVSPALGNGEVYAIEASGALAAFDEKTGAFRWRWRTAERIIGSPVVTATHVLVSTTSMLYAVDLQTRAATWQYPAPGHISIGDNKLIYSAGNTGVLTAFAWFPDSDLDGTADTEDLDRDGDGMLNAWEIQYGFNPDLAADGTADADGDGLPNFREHGLRTNPLVADTDGDGVSDATEVADNLDPLDAQCRDDTCRIVRNGLSPSLLKRMMDRQSQGK